jgi:hypothetical protein
MSTCIDEDSFRNLPSVVGLEQGMAAILLDKIERLALEIESGRAWRRLTAGGRSRTELIADCRGMANLLARLRENLVDPDRNTVALLRQLYGERLGRLLSHEGLGSVLGLPVEDPIDSRFLQSRAAQGRDGPGPAIEAEMTRQRINVANNAAPAALIGLIIALEAPLNSFLEVERRNRGGSPGLIYRNQAIDGLVRIYREVWDTEPTLTRSGRFFRLCHDVLQLLNLPTDGLHSAVSRSLRREKEVQRHMPR